MKSLKIVALVIGVGMLASTVGANSLAVNGAAAMNGTNFGMAVTFDGTTNKAYVRDDTPSDETTYRAQFWFDHNAIAMPDGSFFVLTRITDNDVGGTPGDMRSCVQLMLVHRFGLYRLGARAGNNNAANWRITGRINLDDAPNLIQVEWLASDLPGTLNGLVELTILDGPQAGLNTSAALNNSFFGCDDVLLGAVGNIPAGITGTAYFDEFASFRTLAP